MDQGQSEIVRLSETDILNESLKKFNRKFRPEDNFIEWGNGQNTQALDWIKNKASAPEERIALEKIINTNPDMGIMLDEEGWFIFPIDLLQILDQKGWRHIMIHQGFINKQGDKPFDNGKQLDETGLWGKLDGPTYIAPIDSTTIAPNFVFPEDEKAQKPVTLYINAEKLAEARPIWTDPEQIFEVIDKDEQAIPQNAFYVVGGIPAEAIIYISEDKPNINLF